jgi:hypothetical protein
MKTILADQWQRFLRKWAILNDSLHANAGHKMATHSKSKTCKLKPVNPERLAKAIERLATPPAASEKPSRPLECDDFLFLPFGDSSRFLRVREIKYIRAAGVYSEICAASLLSGHF